MATEDLERAVKDYESRGVEEDLSRAKEVEPSEF